jgi:hypothetical protein
MKKSLKVTTLFALLFVSFSALVSCKRDPSVMKIFVRSDSNQLENNAKVIIIGDVYSNPATKAYVDTLFTNSTGFAVFDMTDYFGDKPTKGEVGYFDIIVKKDTRTGTGRIRCRANITNVETVYLQP